MTRYAVVQVRGTVNTKHEIKDTLKMLKLSGQNSCVITEAPETMLRVVKDYVTWGEVSDETLKLLKEKRGESPYGLAPPKKGYGSTKTPFAQGGTLGYRGEAINGLLKRMI